MQELRRGVAPPPKRWVNRPIHRGYPVPWFCAVIDGVPDFRIADTVKFDMAVKFSFCWLCGQPLGSNRFFVVGPMCTLNHITSEPPSHRDCAIYALETCPHMINPNAKYREANRPDGTQAPAGEPVFTNPGTQVLWKSSDYHAFNVDSGGVLIDIGNPEYVEWWHRGERAGFGQASYALGVAAGTLLRQNAEKAGISDEIRESGRKVIVAATEIMREWLPNE